MVGLRAARHMIVLPAARMSPDFQVEHSGHAVAERRFLAQGRIYDTERWDCWGFPLLTLRANDVDNVSASRFQDLMESGTHRRGPP